jgi:signal peptidase I
MGSKQRRFSIFLVNVQGESMWPNLVAGRRYLATSLLEPKRGDVIVFREESEVMVKRVIEAKEGNYVAGGTVPWSSTHIVPHSAVIGTLLRKRSKRLLRPAVL